MSSSPNFAIFLRVGFLAFWSFSSVFVFCDSSERIASYFDDVDVYNLCNWYSFPANIQNVMPIIIMNTQVPVVLEGFGSIPCTRETCKRVNSFGSSNHRFYSKLFSIYSSRSTADSRISWSFASFWSNWITNINSMQMQLLGFTWIYLFIEIRRNSKKEQ